MPLLCTCDGCPSTNSAETIASILGTSTERGSRDLQHGLFVGEQPVQRVLLLGTLYRANAST